MDVSKRVRRPADLAQVVISARTAAGWTQARLAQEAGVSRKWLTLFENGKTPGAELAKVLVVLVVLGVDVTASFTVATEEP